MNEAVAEIVGAAAVLRLCRSASRQGWKRNRFVDPAHASGVPACC